MFFFLHYALCPFLPLYVTYTTQTPPPPPPPPPMSTSSPSVSEVDAAVWRAVAGASSHIPPLNSYVYYFPQGHMEQHSSASVENQNIELKRPFIPCQVLSVRLLSNPSSDQVFVKFLLQPLHAREKRLNCSIGDSNENDLVSFAKVLTPSDANNGGGFSVPRFCADSIFPPLDFASDPPVQNLIMKDTHNNAWEFRHIYRGTPRRHLLTTGWSKFVNAKRLIAGDSVVFMRKKSTNELFTGIRRVGRFGCSSCWDGGENSANSSMSVVSEAIKNSDKGTAFEVVHYPRFGSPDFVVSAEKVEDALRLCWSVGMRVKMAVESEDSSRMTWSQGTVAATVLPDSGPWCGSPWRMLQVTWDEPETLLNMRRVNPWQVEYIPPTSQLHSAFPPPKKFKGLQSSGMISDGEEEFRFPMVELARSMAGHMNSPIFNYYSPFPASMQGARQDQFCIPSSSNSQSNKPFQMFTQLLSNQIEQELRTVSTVLNIGTPQSGNSSQSTQSTSVHLNGADLVAMQGNNTSPKVGANSFQLFGKIIHASDSVEGGSEANISCTDGEMNHVFGEGSSAGNPSSGQTSVAEFNIISKERQL